jgi:hypothetical protein
MKKFLIAGAAAGIAAFIAFPINGEDGFGPRGEIANVLASPVKILDGNVKAAAEESGEVAKVLRAVTGVSVRDIQKFGIFGGPNSVFHRVELEPESKRALETLRTQMGGESLIGDLLTAYCHHGMSYEEFAARARRRLDGSGIPACVSAI